MGSTNRDYSVSIAVNKTPAEVYNAIKDVKAWWIGQIKGDANEVGSTFNYQYKVYHDSTQKVTELIPNKRVVWHVVEATVAGVQNTHEWNGTDIIFDIIPKGEQTEVKFTHRGLTPQFECYDACSGGWDFFVTKSLQNFLLEGKGIDPKFGE